MQTITPQPMNTTFPMTTQPTNTTFPMTTQPIDTNMTPEPVNTTATPYPTAIPYTSQQILNNQLVKCNINMTALENNLKIMGEKISAYNVKMHDVYYQPMDSSGMMMYNNNTQELNDLLKFYVTDDFYNSFVNVANVIINTDPNNLACVNDMDPAFCDKIDIVTKNINTDDLLLVVKKYQPVITSLYNLLSKYSDITATKCGKNKKLENLRNIMGILCGIVSPKYDYYYMGTIACLVCIIFILIGVIILQML